MSIKHVKDYYQQVASQYKQLLSNIKEFEKEAEKGLIAPERLDEIKQSIKPVLDNYMTLSYIMFLLDQPQRKSKQKDFEKRNKKLLNSIDDKYKQDSIIKNNNNILNKTFNK